MQYFNRGKAAHNQVFLPSRGFDPVDMAFNGFAALMSVVAMVTLGWARRLTSGFRSSS